MGPRARPPAVRWPRGHRSDRIVKEPCASSGRLWSSSKSSLVCGRLRTVAAERLPCHVGVLGASFGRRWSSSTPFILHPSSTILHPLSLLRKVSLLDQLEFSPSRPNSFFRNLPIFCPWILLDRSDTPKPAQSPATHASPGVLARLHLQRRGPDACRLGLDRPSFGPGRILRLTVYVLSSASELANAS